MTSELLDGPFRPLRSAKIAAILRRSLAPLALAWTFPGGACTVAHPGDDLSQAEPAPGEPEPSGETQLSTGTRNGTAGGMLEPAGVGGAPQATPSDDDRAAAADAGSCAAAAAEIGAFWIGFDSDRNAYNRDLYAIRVDGSGLTRLTTGPSSEREPAFSLDGRRLAYVSDASGSAQIYIYDFTSGRRMQLTQRPEGADQPSWSPDGLQLVFHSGASVYLADADGGGERELTRGLDHFNAYKNPTFSADGREVVFDRNNEINAIGVDGTGLRQVIQNWTTTIVAPSVSSDGYNIAYTVNCSTGLEARGAQIAIAPLASSPAPPCGAMATPASSASARQPAWGPEQFIAYELGSGSGSGASRIALSVGPEAEPCTLEREGSSRDLNPAWAPEGFELPDGFEPF